MSGIASSLEQEFADHSQAEREANIAELRRIEAGGRASVAVAAHSIVLPAFVGLIACGLFYEVLTRQDVSTTRLVTTLACSVVVAAFCAWLLFGKRAPRFTLTEQGVQLKNGLLPWQDIEDYGVVENSTNGLATHTSVSFHLADGFTPPPLGMLILFGQTSPIRSKDAKKPSQFIVRLTLHVGARGMSCEKLAERIGQFLAAFHARAELQRLGA